MKIPHAHKHLHTVRRRSSTSLIAHQNIKPLFIERLAPGAVALVLAIPPGTFIADPLGVGGEVGALPAHGVVVVIAPSAQRC